MPPYRICLSWFAIAAGLMAFSVQALADNCPGNPNAIGTSRTIVVDPTEHPHIGTMQYGETLPLRDHEAVLSFDDGPLPRYSNQVLAILASQCVKATFFTIGRMAQAFPDGVKRLRDAGHTIGTHSQSHPLSFERMPIEKVAQEVDDGIVSVKAALGDDKDLAPFFRIPGLLRSPQVDEFLASRGLMTWSADFLADDWRNVSPARVAKLALSRLEAKGKGVLLLHDIHARTVAALPTILRDLKARGFRIVHVVWATPDRPKTPTEPNEWRIKPQPAIAMAKWPAAPRFAFAETMPTPAPDIADLGVADTAESVIAASAKDLPRPGARPRIPLPPASIWPRQVTSPAVALTSLLPVPAGQLFRSSYGPVEPAMSAPPHADPARHADIKPPAVDRSGTEREAMTELVPARFDNP
jgi:peptidoglycan/xylan/chitin deacetylase (PgdA/CDA1 family)